MLNTLSLGILLSMLPLGELRAGIPVIIASKVGILNAFLIGTFANIFIIPFIYIFLDSVHLELMKWRVYNYFFNKSIKSIRHKVHNAVQKWGFLGLLIFVATPLPGTGAYSAILGSWILGIDRAKSQMSIALGVIIAGIIVTLISLGVIHGFKLI